MMYSICNYDVMPETYLKSMVLTNGIIFSDSALQFAMENNAKRQNLVYNMPIGASKERPQEMLIRNIADGYETVVSCVSPASNSKAVLLDYINGQLTASVRGIPIQDVEIEFVQQPQYYSTLLKSGKSVKQYVTACGFDEFNILPWKGCAISQMCKFCGANSFVEHDSISAVALSKNHNLWLQHRDSYFSELDEAIRLAVADKCYQKHMHVILIAGNLADDDLDFESEIFAEISERILPLIQDKSSEGIVLVITPPRTPSLLAKLKMSGVSRVVFNLEAISRQGFQKYCPGKNSIGYDFFLERLEMAVSVWGKGNVWSNLVLGLESNDVSLPLCEQLANMGIVISANVLHLDKGNRLDCSPPGLEQVMDFYFNLERINSCHGFKPFYCSKALRTSLSNEAHDLRIKERN